MGLPARLLLLLPLLLGLASAAVAVAAEASEGDADPLYKYAPLLLAEIFSPSVICLALARSAVLVASLVVWWGQYYEYGPQGLYTPFSSLPFFINLSARAPPCSA